MEKIEAIDNDKSIFEVEKKVANLLQQMNMIIKHLEKLIKVAHSANPKEEIFKLDVLELKYIFGFFDDNGTLKRCPNAYDYCDFILSIKERLDKEKGKDKKIFLSSMIVLNEDEFDDIPPFLNYLSECAKKTVDFTKIKYEGINKVVEAEKKFRYKVNINQLISGKEILDLKKYLMDIEEINCMPLLTASYQNNQILIEQLKEKQKSGEILSKEEQLKQKKNKYIKTYHLNIDDNISIDTIEKVISSFKFGLSFLQNHPEVFSTKLELFFFNLSLLKEKGIPIKLVLDRDEDAFLCEDLLNHLNLIEMYGISIEQLLLYQKNALTDLSYLTQLDLMIENNCFDLNKLRDKNQTELKIRIMLRLLQMPLLEELLKGSFPLSETEIDEFLDLKSTVLKTGMNETKTCELDSTSIWMDNLTYNFNGVLISRPKVLRNCSNQEIDLDTILCNSFYTEEEIETVKRIFSKEFFTKRRGVL